MSTESRALGARIREVREAKGITQNEAMRAIGVSQPSYSRVESGDRPLKGDELILLADLFNMRVGALTSVVDLADTLPTAARSTAAGTQADSMFQKMLAYIEADQYLEAHGIA